jgi:hypothetical protein
MFINTPSIQVHHYLIVKMEAPCFLATSTIYQSTRCLTSQDIWFGTSCWPQLATDTFNFTTPKCGSNFPSNRTCFDDCPGLAIHSSSGKTKMNMEYWWNDNDRGKLKYSKKNLSHCHSVHHKSHMDWPRIKAGPSQWQAGSTANPFQNLKPIQTSHKNSVQTQNRRACFH